MHAKSRSPALSTVYFQGIFTAMICEVHVATFGQVVLDELMFYLTRMVVDYSSITDTYRVVQMKYKYNVSYSTRVIVSIMYTEEWAGVSSYQHVSYSTRSCETYKHNRHI